MKTIIIVASDHSNLIGLNNKIPWRLSFDLKRFKEITTGYPIIMGRKTYDSIGKPLPNRENIVISRNNELSIDGVVIKYSLEDALEYAQTINSEKCFIIGGSTIYSEALEKKYVDEILYTRVYTLVLYDEMDETVFFPEITRNDWMVDAEFPVQLHEADEKNEYKSMFLKFIKTSSHEI